MTDPEKLKAAIDTVARHLVKKALEQAIEWENVSWEDYPDLTEPDYEAAVARAEAIVDSIAPPEDAYEATYEHLSERAENVDV